MPYPLASVLSSLLGPSQRLLALFAVVAPGPPALPASSRPVSGKRAGRDPLDAPRVCAYRLPMGEIARHLVGGAASPTRSKFKPSDFLPWVALEGHALGLTLPGMVGTNLETETHDERTLCRPLVDEVQASPSLPSKRP